jgi:hypothetical protein
MDVHEMRVDMNCAFKLYSVGVSTLSCDIIVLFCVCHEIAVFLYPSHFALHRCRLIIIVCHVTVFVEYSG